ncbi:hypothetical protein PR202_gb06619 [Eleusine coracana subsp. coracana]|uniref:hydroperoxide dehydratase n=1 Tax=Eleusine coracana subsp. coracana TaxID=191504 RepID=A0AAV5E981_ELECO|nr:hypothetical protein QOZ80_2BG0159890 [Eleusine coracana subsp. coracana]GJN19352.1 hypothetical protein PR202_gb06619 [Eleusine coracana subsp. coracana]
MTTSSSTNGATSGDEQKLSPSGLPIRAIPGGYGVPFLSPLRDRLDYYYLQGPEAFFRTRIARHGGATVLRVNMPPGPFLARDPRVVALLDARSFRVLLDDAKVDKSGTLDGTFIPSASLFGGHFPLAFLDAADPRHAELKRVMMGLAVSRMHAVAPAFRAAFGAMFDAVDAAFRASAGKKKAVEFNKHNAVHMLDFTCAALFGGAAPSKAIGANASRKAVKWLAWQLHPLASGVVKPWPLEHLLLHTVRLPPFLVARDYADLTAYFAAVAAAFLDDHAAGKSSISREELLHNLVFLAIFNAYGGFKIMLPHLVKWLARAGPGLHAKLAAEARNGGGEDDDVVTLADIDRNMPLVKSVVWEALRLNPPVEFQYGRAREDLVVESHDAAYEVKKGEMLFGYQPFATRDERVFDRAGEFVPDRFVVAAGGHEDERRRMLDHVVWSNGAETAAAAEGNKQCPGKDMVVAVARLMVVELFRRYDTFDATIVEMPLEPVVTFTSLTRATTKQP